MKKFGEKVREARKLRGLNQAELGKLIGVSGRSVVTYETKDILPRKGTLKKLSEVLGVSVDYLSCDDVQDPMFDTVDTESSSLMEALYGTRVSWEIDFLMERTAALFAGGDISQEAKDAYFEAVMAAYLECKAKAKAKKELMNKNP